MTLVGGLAPGELGRRRAPPPRVSSTANRPAASWRRGWIIRESRAAGRRPTDGGHAQDEIARLGRVRFAAARTDSCDSSAVRVTVGSLAEEREHRVLARRDPLRRDVRRRRHGRRRARRRRVRDCPSAMRRSAASARASTATPSSTAASRQALRRGRRPVRRRASRRGAPARPSAASVRRTWPTDRRRTPTSAAVVAAQAAANGRAARRRRSRQPAAAASLLADAKLRLPVRQVERRSRRRRRWRRRGPWSAPGCAEAALPRQEVDAVDVAVGVEVGG